VSRQRVFRNRRACAVSVIAALAGLLMIESACAGAGTSRLHNVQAVLSAFGRSGITLHVLLHARTAPSSPRGVTVVDMRQAEAIRFRYDAQAWVFPTVAAARVWRSDMGDVHDADGGFARLVDNVLVLVTPWQNSGMGGVLRDVPTSVKEALLRLRSG
jgi:hypothetical protein